MIQGIQRALRADLPELPRHMQGLPVDKRGFPVPFFVHWVDGEPRFDIVDTRRYEACVQKELCWLCGERLGRYRAFVIGPMCLVNRISSEPPSHLDCAEFACTACPFLTRPLAKRVEQEDEVIAPAGVMIARNPGATAVWVTTAEGYEYFVPRGSRSPLIQLMSTPTQLHAWARGKPLQWEALMDSLESGMPLLEEHCDGDPQAFEALRVAERDARRIVDRFWVKRPLPVQPDAPTLPG